mgnify:CR=1 FL=1|tara:strand:+ start:782 stop:1120 length:339 start_codon:yes stop_codon:yes gene_type:complete
MKNLIEVKFDLPIYWATYIMYADESGLEEGEKEIIDEILQDLEVTNCVDVLDNQYLELYPPNYMPSNMGGDYCTYVFLEDLEDSQAGRDSQAGINTVSEPIKNNQLELFPKS